MPIVPALIQGLSQPQQTYVPLSPVSLTTPPYNEDWLQNLIHNQPSMVPVGEIEACFDKLVPVLREFSLPSGYLDNFYITPDGYPVLVEVKLWKNQEARRKVVAQILEYAKDFAALSYEDINTELKKQLRTKTWGENPLYEIVMSYAADALDEARFVDAVTRNLREGRFLLIILGDGIREEMANLAQYLMQHSLRYAFGMIEIKLFTLPDGSIIAQPFVLAKTQTIERHVTVVTTQGADIMVTSPSRTVSTVVSEKIEKTSLSLDEFFRLVAEHDPQNVAFIKDLLESLSDLPIEPEIGSKGETLMLKMTVSSGERIQFMLFTLTSVELWGIPSKKWENPTWQHLSLAYLERITALVSGAVIQIFNSGANIKQDGKTLRMSVLHGKIPEIAEAIRCVAKDVEAFYAAENTGRS